MYLIFHFFRHIIYILLTNTFTVMLECHPWVWLPNCRQNVCCSASVRLSYMYWMASILVVSDTFCVKYWALEVQALCLSLFGHIARMPDETDARSIITAPPSENWRKPPGRPLTMWMKTIQQDLTSNNLSLDEVITGSDRPLMSAFGATHP